MTHPTISLPTFEEDVFVPNHFQEDIFTFIADPTKGNLMVIAKAGTGKTQTILEAVKLIPANKKVIILAFSKHIADELREKVPRNIEVRTTHSMGFEAIRDFNGSRKTFGGNKNKIYKILDEVIRARNERFIKKNNKSELISKPLLDEFKTKMVHTVEQFRNTLMLVNEENLNAIAFKFELTITSISTEAKLEIIENVLEGDRADTINIDYTDMIYLSTSMMMPFRKFDYVFVDETQDIAESQLRMLLMLRNENGRIIAVGDEKQCVIEGTKISTSEGLKNVEDITTEDNVLCGMGNVSTIYAPVQEIFNKEVHDNSVIRIVTESGKELVTTPEHIHFARYQDGYQRAGQNDHFLVYLMYKEEFGYRIGFTKGHKARTNQEGADKVWFLDSVETRREANYLEQFYSVKYGLPRWIFRSYLGDVSYEQEDIQKLFSSLDTEFGAKKLLKSKNMFIDYPHHTPKCSTLDRRRNFSITICGDWRQEKDGNKNPTMHRYAISGSNLEDGEKLRALGLNVRQAKTPGTWRLESSSSKLGDIYEKLRKVQSVMDVNIIETARLGDRALTLTPASHILPGMGIFIEDDGKVIEDKVIKVDSERYTGRVYDINIDRYHNYVANGIVTHNSIYAFRGADTDAMKKIGLATSAEQLPLNICYRCPKTHIKMANQYVPDMEPAPDAIDGELFVISGEMLYQHIQPGDLAICRNNAPLIRPALALLKQGIKVNIRGQNLRKSLIDLIKETKTNDIGRMCNMIIEFREEEVERLQKKGKNPLSIIDKVGVILEFARDSVTVQELINYINILLNDTDAEITFSTVHGAKGLESENIFFINSFLIPSPYAVQEWELQGEENIMYVALTRAKKKLYFVDVHDNGISPEVQDHIEYRNNMIRHAIKSVEIDSGNDNANATNVVFDEDYVTDLLSKKAQG